MSLNHVPTVDELLADGLVQALMRADHVEPAELRTLLGGVAGRIARQRRGDRKAMRFFATPRLEWRPAAEGENALPRALLSSVAKACGAGLCC
jgi:hypothetical protein